VSIMCQDRMFGRNSKAAGSIVGGYVWRDVARNTDSRTLIAAIIPEVVTTDKLPVGILRVPSLAPLLVANFSAFVVDYIARQKDG